MSFYYFVQIAPNVIHYFTREQGKLAADFAQYHNTDVKVVEAAKPTRNLHLEHKNVLHS
jgi:hypothetical protein